jgi:hypothetical protein
VPLDDALQVALDALPNRWWDWSAYDLAIRIVVALGLEVGAEPTVSDWPRQEHVPLNDAVQVAVNALPDRWWDCPAHDLATRIVSALGVDYGLLSPKRVGSPPSVAAAGSSGPSPVGT